VGAVPLSNRVKPLHAQSFISTLRSVRPKSVESNHPVVSDLCVAELFLQAKPESVSSQALLYGKHVNLRPRPAAGVTPPTNVHFVKLTPSDLTETVNLTGTAALREETPSVG
jgi:hypothetical protein